MLFALLPAFLSVSSKEGMELGKNKKQKQASAASRGGAEIMKKSAIITFTFKIHSEIAIPEHGIRLPLSK
jgi:hypothetical protein